MKPISTIIFFRSGNTFREIREIKNVDGRTDKKHVFSLLYRFIHANTTTYFSVQTGLFYYVFLLTLFYIVIHSPSSCHPLCNKLHSCTLRYTLLHYAKLFLDFLRPPALKRHPFYDQSAVIGTSSCDVTSNVTFDLALTWSLATIWRLTFKFDVKLMKLGIRQRHFF